MAAQADADAATAVGRPTIPQAGPGWPLVSAYLPLRQRLRVKRTGEFHRADAVRQYRVFDEDLSAEPGRWVLFGAFQSHVPHLLDSGLLAGGAVVWSMWDGYLEQASGQRLTGRLAEARVPLIHHHTSGHASAGDLARLADAIDPAVVVPIHTQAPEAYAAALDRPVAVQPDGRWWDVPR